MRAFEMVQSVPWAITPDALQTILVIANRESTDAMLERALERRHQAVAAQPGQRLDGTRTVTMRDNVAIVAINGPIVRYADIFSEISGATSIQPLGRDFSRVVNDPAVQGIVLDIDSPGGEINGIHEFASMVYAARGKKPIRAYVGGLGASAAYWIASAADEIVVAPTGLVGSIGVVAAVRDPSKTNARDIEFVSSQSPKKRPDPTTESGRGQIQVVVDELASVFVSSVAHHRAVSEAKVLSDYGQGGLLVGASSVSAGVADRLGSFEQVIADARRPKTTATRQGAIQDPGVTADARRRQLLAATPLGREMLAQEKVVEEATASARAYALRQNRQQEKAR